MKDLIEFVVKALVDDSAAVQVISQAKENQDVYKVKVAKEDMGKLIGKQGRTIKALRTILKSVSAREGKRAALEIEE